MAKATSIQLDDDLSERVEHLAATSQRTPVSIVHEAVTQYIAREERRKSFDSDTLKAWDEFRQTGQHADIRDVEAWLSTWGSDSEVQPPECKA